MKIENLKLNFNEINKIIDKLSELIKDKKDKSICIALIGDLGTGKTAFAKRMLKNLGVQEAVKSPTFTYLIEYSGDIDIAHFDVYRINSEEDLYDIGFFDYIGSSDLILIEWADLILNSLPEDSLYFELKHNDLDSRFVSLYEMKDGEKEYVDISNYNFN